MKALFRKDFQNLNKYQSSIEEGFQDGMVILDANENPFPKAQNINRYPKLERNELMSLLSNQLGVNSDQLFIGNGSDEVLDLICRLFIDPKEDEVLLFEPSFSMFETLVKLNFGKPVKIQLDESFDIKVEEIKSELSRAKLIFICSPNNPTGNQLSKARLQSILSLAKGIVVVDEAYVEFADYSVLDWLKDYPNLIVTRTFSKAKGAAGIRIGYGIANPEIIAALDKISIPYTSSILNLNAAIEVLKNEEIQDEIIMIKNERLRLEQALATKKQAVKVYPSQANFLLVKFENANETYVYLKSNNVLVRNRSQLQGCENCLRLTIGTPEENQKLLNLLQ